jgi:iron(III) transport system ATP-binding protein
LTTVAKSVVPDGRAHCALGDLAVRNHSAGGTAQVLIRPEQIRLDYAADAVGVDARVKEISYSESVMEAVAFSETHG